MSLIITLIICALVLFFFEIFVPGMILFIFGAILLLIASVVTFVNYGFQMGFMVLVGAGLLSVALFFLELKFLTKSRFARGLFLTRENKEVSNLPVGTLDLLGKTGVTLTVMSPRGFVLVENKKYQAFSKSGHLHQGANIKVVAQDAFKITVQAE